MENELKEYQYFLAALRDFDSRFGHGAKASIASGANYTTSFLSLVISGKKRAGFESQVGIANACGFDYLDFLRLGREIVERRPGGKLRELKAVMPDYCPEMESAIKDLDRLRRADLRGFDRLCGQIEILADSAEGRQRKAKGNPGESLGK